MKTKTLMPKDKRTTSNYHIFKKSSASPQLWSRLLELKREAFPKSTKEVRTMDNWDAYALHCTLNNKGKNWGVIAYGRILPKNTLLENPSFSRVLVRKEDRGMGRGREIVKHLIKLIRLYYANPQFIDIVVREHLIKFYESFGFEIVCKKDETFILMRLNTYTYDEDAH